MEPPSLSVERWQPMTLSLILFHRYRADELIGHLAHLQFRDPNRFFAAGEMHPHLDYWETIALLDPCEQHDQVLRWIWHKVSTFPYFQPFTASFKRIRDDSDRPPLIILKNHVSCQPFCEFIANTLLDRLKTDAISLVGGRYRAPTFAGFCHLRLNRLNLAYVMRTVSETLRLNMVFGLDVRLP